MEEKPHHITSIHVWRRMSRKQKRYALQARQTRPRRPFVFGVGLTSTGQTSLVMALELLGFRTHQGGYGEDSWRYVFENNRTLIENVGVSDDAWLDWPTYIMDDLRETYPGSLWIATVRDVQNWCQSVLRRFYTGQKKANLAGIDLPFCANLELRRRLYGQMFPTERRLISGYRKHIERLEQLEKTHGEKVCRIDIADPDKWAILCEFLDLPRPPFEYPSIKPGRKGAYPPQVG